MVALEPSGELLELLLALLRVQLHRRPERRLHLRMLILRPSRCGACGCSAGWGDPNTFSIAFLSAFEPSITNSRRLPGSRPRSTRSSRAGHLGVLTRSFPHAQHASFRLSPRLARGASPSGSRPGRSPGSHASSRRSISSFSTRSEASTVSRLTADLLTPTVSAISPITRPYVRVLTPAIRSSIRSATAPGLRIAAYAGPHLATLPGAPALVAVTFRSDR